MNNPFEVLGLRGWADQEEIRSAYRALVKQCHPDMIRDPILKREAQERMIHLNLAYEEALRLAAPRTAKIPGPELSSAEVIIMAERSLSRNQPENALRQLLRSDQRNGDWYYMQGKVLMAMEEFESAHQSFREAVRLSPENNVYRSGALAAYVAQKKEATFPGKVKKALKKITRK